jgi:transcriptional regulator with XRE-family HTH domain
MENLGFVGKMNCYRENRGISKAQMARDLDTDAGTLGNILRGVRGIPTEMLAKFLAVYTDVSAEWFMRGQGEMLLAVSPISADASRLATENEKLRSEIIRLHLELADLRPSQKAAAV